MDIQEPSNVSGLPDDVLKFSNDKFFDYIRLAIDEAAVKIFEAQEIRNNAVLATTTTEEVLAILDCDVEELRDIKKKSNRPLFQTFGKSIYEAEWLPSNINHPKVILLKINSTRASKEASFYVDLSRHPHIVRT
ncbi:unnamed protein product, partial [Didymodactylos carnosus]